jgi:hypothetical protein
MDHIEEFVDERQTGWCVHCGGSVGELKTNRDHVPSKSLLRKPYPENLPVVEVCEACNSGFSLDEEYLVTLLGCALSGSSEPEHQGNPAVGAILRRSPGLKARIEQGRTDVPTLFGDTRTFWTAELDRVNRVIVKNARGHAFFEYGEPRLSAPTHVWSAALESLTQEQRENFENVDVGGGWPEVGSRMMRRVMTGQDLIGDWVVVQDGVYRYAIAQQGVMLVRTVLHEYLATEVYWSE